MYSSTETLVALQSKILKANDGGALTALQVGEILGVTPKHVLKTIPAFRIGTSVRFCPASVNKYLKETQ